MSRFSGLLSRLHLVNWKKIIPFLIILNEMSLLKHRIVQVQQPQNSLDLVPWKFFLLPKVHFKSKRIDVEDIKGNCFYQWKIHRIKYVEFQVAYNEEN